MQILCIGDVVGSHGCDFLRRTLPAFKRTKKGFASMPAAVEPAWPRQM